MTELEPRVPAAAAMRTPAHPLDSIAWHSLTGPHRGFAMGGNSVRRYVRGFAPIAAFDPARPADGRSLAALFEPGETASLTEVDALGPLWRHWEVVRRKRFAQLVLRPPCLRLASPAPALRTLGPDDAAAMRDLIAAAAPGPFGERSHEIGSWLGVFDGHDLVAMAGSRLRAAGWREIASVCTAASHRGRGHAERLVRRLAADALAAGDTPFLHVAEDNGVAERLYRRIGFRPRRTVRSVVLRRIA